MNDRITPAYFHSTRDTKDWRVLLRTAWALFRTESFAAGVAFVDGIAKLAEQADHHPDIDLRYASVTVRLTSHDVGGLSLRDLSLARSISTLARERQLSADPHAVEVAEISVDALDRAAVRPFWRAVLGYVDGPEVESGPDDRDLVDPEGRGPAFWFQQMEAFRPHRNRLHVDVYVPHDRALQRVREALIAGGTLLREDNAPSFWVLADPEGNEACVCTWQDASMVA